VAVRKRAQRTKRGRPNPIEQENQGYAEHRRGLTMVDPWAMLLEQLMKVPMEETVANGGLNARRAARAQPDAGSVIKPGRSKKGKGGNEQG
jgi:hypothetical protein